MAIFDALGQYATNRFNSAITNLGNQASNAAQYITDPRAALERRMAEEEEERKRREREQQLMAEMEQRQRDQDAANTPVKTTIVSNPDGTQEMTIKGTPQALSPMNTATPTVSNVMPAVAGPAVPMPMGPAQDQQAQTDALAEEQRRREQQAAEAQQRDFQDRVLQQQAEAQAMPQAQAQATPVAPVAMPAAAPAQAPTPDQQVRPVAPGQAPDTTAEQPQRVIRFGETMPEVEPAVLAQARPTTTTDVSAGTTGRVAQATPAPAAPAEKDFSQTFRGIEQNPEALAKIMSGSQDPAERKIAGDLLRSYYQGQDKAENAKDIVNRAYEQNDPQAQTQMQRELKKKDGSYVKAYLYARLGLTKLAEEEQDKLGLGKRTIEQIALDGKRYTVERDSRGGITRGYDSAGDRIDNKMVARLQAEGQKTGGQIYSSPATAMIIPGGQADAGEEYRTTFDSTTGTFKNIITTGRNAGTEYKGPAGFERRVSTQAQIDYNAAVNAFNTRPNLAAAEQMMRFAAVAYPPGSPELTRTLDLIRQQLGPAASNTIMKNMPPGIIQQPPGGQGTKGTTPTTATSTTEDQPRPGESEIAFRSRMEAKGKRVGAREEAVGKEEGITQAQVVKNQRQSDDAYKLIVPIANALKDATGSYIGAGADELARLVGISTKGSQATAKLNVLSQKIVMNVPRFEGPQGVLDVQLYRQAAGDLNNRTLPVSDRLAALETIVEILKRNDTEGKHDWSFGGQGQSDVRKKADDIIKGKKK